MTLYPFNQYTGGKNACGGYQTIINLIPPHTCYIEPFLGSGAIYRNKLRASLSVLNDLDKSVVEKWKKANLPPEVILHNMDAAGLILMNKDASADTFMYLDPPYPFSTRSYKKKLYKCEMTDQQHLILLAYCSILRCKVMISSYENEMYDQQLQGWNKHKFIQQTRKGTREECLYFNYSLPTQLHDYTHLGANFKDREYLRIQRNRIIKKLGAMEALQRNMIIDTILKEFRSEL